MNDFLLVIFLRSLDFDIRFIASKDAVIGDAQGARHTRYVCD